MNPHFIICPECNSKGDNLFIHSTLGWWWRLTYPKPVKGLKKCMWCGNFQNDLIKWDTTEIYLPLIGHE